MTAETAHEVVPVPSKRSTGSAAAIAAGSVGAGTIAAVCALRDPHPVKVSGATVKTLVVRIKRGEKEIQRRKECTKAASNRFTVVIIRARREVKRRAKGALIGVVFLLAAAIKPKIAIPQLEIRISFRNYLL